MAEKPKRGRNMTFKDLEKMVHHLSVCNNRSDVDFSKIESSCKKVIGLTDLFISISKGDLEKLVGLKKMQIYVSRFNADDIHINVNIYEYDKSFNSNDLFNTDYSVKTFLEAYKLVESTIQAFIA